MEKADLLHISDLPTLPTHNFGLEIGIDFKYDHKLALTPIIRWRKFQVDITLYTNLLVF